MDRYWTFNNLRSCVLEVTVDWDCSSLHQGPGSVLGGEPEILKCRGGKKKKKKTSTAALVSVIPHGIPRARVLRGQAEAGGRWVALRQLSGSQDAHGSCICRHAGLHPGSKECLMQALRIILCPDWLRVIFTSEAPDFPPSCVQTSHTFHRPSPSHPRSVTQLWENGPHHLSPLLLTEMNIYNCTV